MWLTTWPANGIPQYAEHPTEKAAEAHAAQVVRAGAKSATAFWSEIAGTLDERKDAA